MVLNAAGQTFCGMICAAAVVVQHLLMQSAIGHAETYVAVTLAALLIMVVSPG